MIKLNCKVNIEIESANNNKRVKLEIIPPVTIERIKTEFFDRKYDLICGDQKLENGTILSDYTNDKNPCLKLKPSKNIRMQIYYKNIFGNCCPLEVNLYDTVKNVKTKIQEKECIPVEAQFLLFRGSELEDDHLLDEYNIEKGSCLILLLNTINF